MAERSPDGGRLLGHDPLQDDDLVMAELFGGRPVVPYLVEPVGRARRGGARRSRGTSATAPAPRGRRAEKPRPTHYRIVSFSLYLEDICRLDELVRQLKDQGYSKANKSQVIRYALATVDIDKMPRMV
ncbi:MAG: hypothetical protein RBU45_14110 [Myxococcota bacterium]|nr:hypothetical protein [Myxococcota bacterium]